MEESTPRNVEENYEIYDTVLIGKGVDEKYPGGFASYAAMAAADEVPFLNIRNSSEAGKVYTNITSKDKLPWGFFMESIGIKFFVPTPIKVVDASLSAELAKAKFFMTTLQEHAYLDFLIREDTILTIKPTMIPSGTSAIGHESSVAGAPHSYLVSNGQAYVKNRFSYGRNPVAIPRDTPIKASLRFSELGKELLTAMGEVGDLEFGITGTEVEVHNTAMIELSLRGFRLVQQRGEWHYSA